jgi:hypothetical protein
MDFTKWLGKAAGSPRGVSDLERMRSILGMLASRPLAKNASPRAANNRIQGLTVNISRTECDSTDLEAAHSILDRDGQAGREVSLPKAGWSKTD